MSKKRTAKERWMANRSPAGHLFFVHTHPETSDVLEKMLESKTRKTRCSRSEAILNWEAELFFWMLWNRPLRKEPEET